MTKPLTSHPAKAQKLTERQMEILGFLYEWIDMMGYPPLQIDIVDGTGQSQSVIGTRLRALSIRGLVEIKKDTRGLRVVSVHHPEMGTVKVTNTVRKYAGKDDQIDINCPDDEYMERKCLCCNCTYKTNSPYIRLCRKCKSEKTDLALINVSHYGYLSNLQAILTGNVGGSFMSPSGKKKF